MFKSLFIFTLVASLAGCSLFKDEPSAIDTLSPKEPNPILCQEAKLDLVDVEAINDVSKINFVKARVHKYCDEPE